MAIGIYRQGAVDDAQPELAEALELFERIQRDEML